MYIYKCEIICAGSYCKKCKRELKGVRKMLCSYVRGW